MICSSFCVKQNWREPERKDIVREKQSVVLKPTGAAVRNLAVNDKQPLGSVVAEVRRLSGSTHPTPTLDLLLLDTSDSLTSDHTASFTQFHHSYGTSF